MPNVRYSRRAANDLDAIWDHIAQDNPHAADSLLRAISAKAMLVLTQPRMGAMRNDLAENLRSIPEGNYVIFYRPLSDGLEIIRVLHSVRDIQTSFAQ